MPPKCIKKNTALLSQKHYLQCSQRNTFHCGATFHQKLTFCTLSEQHRPYTYTAKCRPFCWLSHSRGSLCRMLQQGKRKPTFWKRKCHNLQHHNLEPPQSHFLKPKKLRKGNKTKTHEQTDGKNFICNPIPPQRILLDTHRETHPIVLLHSTKTSPIHLVTSMPFCWLSYTKGKCVEGKDNRTPHSGN